MALKRIDFLKLGLTAGDYMIAMHQALAGGDRKKFLQVRSRMREWLRKTMLESPLAIYPAQIGRYSYLAVK